jgi:hypothetical protein
MRPDGLRMRKSVMKYYGIEELAIEQSSQFQSAECDKKEVSTIENSAQVSESTINSSSEPLSVGQT